ncbi:hypothetical protein BKA70DRAFT_1231324 [Coprinopsis sp. MPI-PUGE-AT-0042]|nr:hypothetical protein BKA70DRAFT_1231324 [Coprinopsis sp. MPI-PUGE-AT-0042]
MQMGSKWTAEGELTFGERDATRRGEMEIQTNTCLYPKSNETCLKKETSPLLERHDNLVKWFAPDNRALMQKERRWSRILHTNPERNERLIGMGTLANCPSLMMMGATMRAWSREEWEWLREERTDSNVVCPQDA